MISAVVTGVGGRMGRLIASSADARSGIRIVGATEAPGHPAIGRDLGEWLGGKPLGVTVRPVLADVLADVRVVIDFTVPEAAARHAEEAAAAGAALVAGTTGLEPAHHAAIRRAAEKVAVVQSPNMSIGVNILFRLAEEAARATGADYDIEIIEAHHKGKTDAPSGTALRLGEAAAAGRGMRLRDAAVFGRHGKTGRRGYREIGIHAVRAGDIVGDHTVLFAGPWERIELVHRAHARETFAAGALRAALFAASSRPGLYDMLDVLGLRADRG